MVTLFFQVGEWTQNEGLSIFRKKDILFSEGRETVYDFNSSLANKTINIVTIEEPPFVSFTHDNFDEDNIDPSHIEGEIWFKKTFALYILWIKSEKYFTKIVILDLL